MSSNEEGHIYNLTEEQKLILREYWNALFEYFTVEVDYSKCTTDEERAKERQKVIEGKLHKRSRMNLDNSCDDGVSSDMENLQLGDSTNQINVDPVNGLLSPNVDANSSTPITLSTSNLSSSSPNSPSLTPKLGSRSPKLGAKKDKRSSFKGFLRRKSNSNIAGNNDSAANDSPCGSPPYSYNTPYYKGLSEIKLDNENILESMKEEFFYMMSCDEPDSVALRFLRARKWNVNRAIKMTTACLQWRIEWNVRALLEIGEQGIDEEVFKSGKAFIFGKDKENRPLSYVRVRNHNKNTVPLFESEKFTMFLLETGRLSIKPPVEMCSIVFDLTDFSMNNMDYPYVKFVLHCLQNYYPECLGVCLIVNAPWIFMGCWKIIKPLLDPVVSAKVRFIKSEEMKEYINEDQLMKIYGGTNSYEYNYIPPSSEDIEMEKKNKGNDNPEKFKRIEEWRQVIKEYEDITKEWIKKYEMLDKQLRAESADKADSLLKVEKGRGNSNNTSLESIPIDNKDELLQEANKIDKDRKAIGEKHKRAFNKLIPYLYTRTYYQRVKTFDYITEEELDEVQKQLSMNQ
ncbi:hypothetical protein BCR36DRAFT_579647 [Piromyces finnis]|uniref:CRAL-TRIO domain-containing protein n=1 Tax=Piromyces finnis TaxID=1754191 RepID=A0A1Y1VMR8_9FUNG|nr:hypothetical protein BCR36DRAFT_579647 [Piromyces finnis]|eukprot:ORX60204.1 hypothetical protein BCR36DRAFT_579647 [Piromyces finnis]